jgi:hypothetical protein
MSNSTTTRRIVVSRRLFAPSPALLTLMACVQNKRGADDITVAYGAYMLDPGLGPPTYLTADGRIVWDDDLWGIMGTRGEAFSSIMAGVKKTGVQQLRELLPEREATASDCHDCSASGWFDAHGELQDLEGRPFSFVCPRCAGLGWTSPALVLTESVLDDG